ncbi:MAG: tetratricopeptide repeat protein, partial [Chloroflexi bacterium]|nr:tetratricopeptide repeat protein [Chloroflexota bacterium]
GALRREEGRWVWQGQTQEAVRGIPVTLQALIAARVDALDPGPKGLLQVAAVAGRSFSTPLLEQALPPGLREALPTGLRQLAERDLLTAEAGGSRYQFRHGLIRETVYGALLTPVRQELHCSVGQGIEALYEGRLSEQVEVLAYHFTEGRAAARAIPYLLWAGDRSARRFANQEAVGHYEQALAFLEETKGSAADLARAHASLGDVRGFVGQYEAAEQDYRSALALVQAAPEPEATQVAEMQRRLARVYQRQGDQDEAERWLRRALRELDGDPRAAMAVERARVYNDLGWMHFRRGEMADALTWTTRCLSILEGTSHYGDLAAAYNRLTGMHFRLGDVTQAREVAQRGLRLRRRMGDTHGLALSYNNLGGLAMFSGDWDEALEYNQQSLALKERLGDVPGQRSSHNNLGLIHLLRGDWEKAEAALHQALALARSIQEPWGVSQTLANLIRLDLARGDWTAAGQRLEEGWRLAEESAASEQLTELARLRAERLLGLGELEQAQQAALAAAALAERARDLAEQGAALRVLAAVQRAAGRLVEAAATAERSLERLSEARNRYELGRAYCEQGEVLRLQDRLDDARDSMEKALAIFRRLGARHDATIASRALVALQSATAGLARDTAS